MNSYDGLFKFTEEGMQKLVSVMTGEENEDSLNDKSNQYCIKIEGTNSYEPKPHKSKKGFVLDIFKAFGGEVKEDIFQDKGLWAWLSFVLRDYFYKKDVNGKFNVPESLNSRATYIPDNDYTLKRRHRILTPSFFYWRYGNLADLVCSTTKPREDGEIFSGGEVLNSITSQQEMDTPVFTHIARRLYYNEHTGYIKYGAASGAGAARRLSAIRRQLEHTWDLHGIPQKKLWDMLPKEFDKYKKDTPNDFDWDKEYSILISQKTCSH